MTTIKLKRGTRAQLDAAAAAGQLIVGEPYLITDENRIAVGSSASTYEAYAKVGEAGGAPAGQRFTVLTAGSQYFAGYITTTVTGSGFSATPVINEIGTWSNGALTIGAGMEGVYLIAVTLAVPTYAITWPVLRINGVAMPIASNGKLVQITQATHIERLAAGDVVTVAYYSESNTYIKSGHPGLQMIRVAP